MFIFTLIFCRYPLGPHLNTDIMEALAKENPNIMNETGLGIPLNISEFAFDTSILFCFSFLLIFLLDLFSFAFLFFLCPFSDQFALEQYFYYRLTHSHYLTSDPSEAGIHLL
jgi:hypothetical protein